MWQKLQEIRFLSFSDVNMREIYFTTKIVKKYMSGSVAFEKQYPLGVKRKSNYVV